MTWDKKQPKRLKEIKWNNNNNIERIRHDWVGKMIHWELSKKFKFDHTNRRHLHILENELLWGFKKQKDDLIYARRPDLVIVNKKENLPNSARYRSSWLQGKTEGKRKER